MCLFLLLSLGTVLSSTREKRRLPPNVSDEGNLPSMGPSHFRMMASPAMLSRVLSSGNGSKNSPHKGKGLKQKMMGKGEGHKSPSKSSEGTDSPEAKSSGGMSKGKSKGKGSGGKSKGKSAVEEEEGPTCECLAPTVQFVFQFDADNRQQHKALCIFSDT